jgi:hypothetical protein
VQPEKTIPLVKAQEQSASKIVNTSIKQDVASSVAAVSADVEINYSQVDETIFSKGYGGYRLIVSITSKSKDIYIPKTTTDSTEGYTGFSYAVEGSVFKGVRDSRVDCTITSKGQCKVEAGTTEKIEVMVWLLPEEEGDFAVRFKELGYRYGEKESLNKLSVNKVSETIYLDYK